MSVLPLLSITLVGTLSIVGWAIGVFYRRKFGEATHGWLLLAGGATGVAGAIAHGVGFPDLLAEGILLLGAALLGGGTFWLWFVMMGPRK